MACCSQTSGGSAARVDAAGHRPRPRLARRRGRREPLRSELDRARSGPSACSRRALRPDPLRLRRQPLPAASRRPWWRRATPATWRRCFASAARSGTPRRRCAAGGTSLNGQGQSDGILVDVRRHFARRARSRTTAPRARVRPGTVLGHANRVLAPLRPPARPGPGEHRHRDGRRRRSPTTPAACAAARPQDSYSHGALADARAAVGDDRSTRRRRDAEERFAAAEPELARRPGRDPRRDPRRRRARRANPPQVRDQEHDGLPPVRVPRRGHAARDLPAARSSAPRARSRSSPRPSSTRVPRPAAHDDRAGSTSPTSTPRPSRSRPGRRRRDARSS